MARLFDDAGSNRLLTTTTTVTAAPITIACWVRVDALPATNQVPWAICDSAGDLNYFTINIAATSGQVRGVINAGTSGLVFNGPSSVSVGTWAHVAVVFASTTSRTCYVNGSAGTENTDSRTPSSIDRMCIGSFAGTTINQFVSGDIAEAAVWNVALTAADIGMLADALSPQLVRPEGLVNYLPLVRDIQDTVGATTFTATGTTVAVHPRIIRPRTRRFWQIAAVPPATTTGWGPLLSGYRNQVVIA